MLAQLMGLKTVSPAEVWRLLQPGEGAVVIDVNAPARWSAAHVPGAINLDPATYPGDALPADRQTLLIFYCSNPMCMKAPTAARRAVKLGYGNVRVMPAGITGWLTAKLPTESAA